jgi:hypothetical protein
MLENFALLTSRELADISNDATWPETQNATAARSAAVSTLYLFPNLSWPWCPSPSGMVIHAVL